MPAASSRRSPKALTSRPTNGAISSRISANALTTAPAAALPTPNSAREQRQRGRDQTEAQGHHEGDPRQRPDLGWEVAEQGTPRRYSTGRPRPRAISIRCTSEVPSPISSTLASR